MFHKQARTKKLHPTQRRELLLNSFDTTDRIRSEKWASGVWGIANGNGRDKREEGDQRYVLVADPAVPKARYFAVRLLDRAMESATGRGHAVSNLRELERSLSERQASFALEAAILVIVLLPGGKEDCSCLYPFPSHFWA